jgi:hypothetical protein
MADEKGEDQKLLAVIRNPKPETRNPKLETRNPKPETRNPKTENLKPKIRKPKTGTPNPKPEILNPKPVPSWGRGAGSTLNPYTQTLNQFPDRLWTGIRAGTSWSESMSLSL